MGSSSKKNSREGTLFSSLHKGREQGRDPYLVQAPAAPASPHGQPAPAAPSPQSAPGKGCPACPGRTSSSAATRHARFVIIGLVVFVVAAVVASLMLGRYPISPDEALGMLVSRLFPLDAFWTDQQATLFFNVRLPRILLGLMVGSALPRRAQRSRARSRTRSSRPTSWAPRRARRSARPSPSFSARRRSASRPRPSLFPSWPCCWCFWWAPVRKETTSWWSCSQASW